MDEATGRWVPAGETDGPVTNLEVDGLTPGHKYKFRVKAKTVRYGSFTPWSHTFSSKPVDRRHFGSKPVARTIS